MGLRLYFRSHLQAAGTAGMSVVVPVVLLAGRVELPAQPAVQVFLPPIYSNL